PRRGSIARRGRARAARLHRRATLASRGRCRVSNRTRHVVLRIEVFGSLLYYSARGKSRVPMRGGELDRDIGGRERFVLGKDDAACDSAFRFSRAFFLRLRSFFHRVIG